MGHGPAHGIPRRDDDPGREPGDPDPDPRSGGDRGWRLYPSGPDWPAGEHPADLPEEEPPPEDEDSWAVGVDPKDLDLWLDDGRMAAFYAEAAQVTENATLARAAAERAGVIPVTAAVAAEDRRGPGMPGSAKSYPGEYVSRASGFASGMELDTAPGCVALGLFAEEAAGDDDSYDGASDDELAGVICGWQRSEAHSAARKHAAVAEFIRRRAAAGCSLAGPGRMPEVWDEFAPVELAAVLGETRWAAEGLLDVAHALEAKLPGTKAAFRAGIISEAKAGIIARATAVLDPDEARQAEALVLGRAGRLTPPALAAAITRAVMQVAPEKAKKRREQAAREARVERWAEASGNAGLAGRELPPADVLAADQRVNGWARQLRQAGVAGSMDELRALAYVDLLLGRDSRPSKNPAPGGSGDMAAGPGGSVIPAGFAGKINLTVPAITLLDLAGLPGRSPISVRSTRNPEQIHPIVTDPRCEPTRRGGHGARGLSTRFFPT